MFTSSSGPVVNDPNCEANELPPNDDGSTGEVSLPFTINFFGSQYSSLWVNNNGNVTFSAPLGTYTPFEITATTPPIIAPFFADVDTRGVGSAPVTYGTTTFQGHTAFCVNWRHVGYFAEHTDKLNDFQLLLVERADVAAGSFDIVFNYNQIQWETGDASGGVDGLGGTSAGVGFSNGDGNPTHFFQLPGSLENGALLDSNPSTGLVNSAYGDTLPGRYIFHITGTGGTGGGGGSFSRPWPSTSYGYSFPNHALWEYLVPAGLAPAQVFTAPGLSHTFADWGQFVQTNHGQSNAIARLMRDTTGGVCFGLALSAGRLDGGDEPLLDAAQGRTDPTWQAAGTGPSATMQLPEPGSPTTSAPFNEQFLGLIADDFVTQASSEFSASIQQQHYAYADPTKGATALREQLEAVLGQGHDNYGGGHLSTGHGTGFAEIALQTPGNKVGHAVLAYSMEELPTGTLKIDVWDNNFPGEPHAIYVRPTGTWTYDAVYHNGDFQGVYSMSGAPGHELGLLAAFPLFVPSGLHFYPQPGSGVGSGVLVDVPPGVAIHNASDPSEQPVDEEVMLTGGEPGEAGAVLDFPSGTGSVELSGESPAADFRGVDTYMTVEGAGTLKATANEQAGSIETSSPAQLSVARQTRLISSVGAGGLELGTDGHVSGNADSTTMTIALAFAHDGTVSETTLYSGAAPAGGAINLTPEQVAAAEAAAISRAESEPATTSKAKEAAPKGAGNVLGSSEESPVATLATRGLKVTRTGKVLVTVKCASHVKHCTGTILLKTSTSVAAAKTRRRVLTLATGKFNVPGGSSVRVSLQLSPAARRLLRRTHSLRAKAILTSHRAAGGTSTTYASVTLTVARSRH